jgi:threonyl-tRNA synthetase
LGSDERLARIRHSCAHILAQAVRERFSPKGPVDIATGPATDTGFCYDFDLPVTVSESDLDWLTSRMRDIIRGDHTFVRHEITEAEARQKFADEPYKIEVIDGIMKGALDDNGEPLVGREAPVLSTYTDAEFEDLCAGPHVADTHEIDPDAVKLTSVAGAYWRGDESRPMLQRVYGTAWETKEDLDGFL